MKRFLAFLLAGMMLLLSACGAKQTEPAADEPETLTPGYVPEAVPFPNWLCGSRWVYWDFCGDRIYLCGYADDGKASLGYYSTTEGRYHRFDGALPGVGSVSASEDSVWVLSAQTDWTVREKNWTLFSCSPEGEDPASAAIPFYGGEGENGEGHNVFSEFSGPYALDRERALIFDGAKSYLVDRGANILDTPDLLEMKGGDRFRADGKTYIKTWNEREGECIRFFDKQSLTLGPAVPCESYGVYESTRGRFLCGMGEELCRLDPESGTTERIFSTLDTALCLNETQLMGMLENSEGYFFYVGEGRIVRIVPQMVKERKPLTLLIFGDRNDWRTDSYVNRGETRLLMSDDLREAIIRFNHTDPDYRVEVKTVCYENEQERDRFLVELMTDGAGVDLIDTSLLPERALDSRMLVDMLPYLDADGTIGREDFVPSLLKSMLRNGGLYEFTCRYALLGAATGEKADDWDLNDINRWADEHQDRAVLDLGWQADRETLRDLLCRMATAEFIDWETGSCHFDDGRFAAWLDFLRSVSLDPERSRPALLMPEENLGALSAGTYQQLYGDSLRFTGFPCGSAYWTRAVLNNGFDRAARVAIPTAGKNPEGAWRFVRTLAQSLGRQDLWLGTPPLRENVEKALSSISTAPAQDYAEDPHIYSHPVFTADQIESLRTLIYGTDKMVREDDVLLEILKGEADAVLSGQRGSQTAAANVQSRVSLYVAEQG